MMRVWAAGRTTGSGFSVLDLLIALAVTSLVAALAVPLTAHTVDAARARHAAGLLASHLRLARQRALTTRRTTAVVFDLAGGVWTMGVWQDGNGNGVRRAEIASGVDRQISAREDLGQRFPGVAIAVTDTIPGPEGDPPTVDPVNFGASSMASCSPVGGCTPGTVFVRSARGDQWAVRLGNMTGRARVLHYERGSGQWSAE